MYQPWITSEVEDEGLRGIGHPGAQTQHEKRNTVKSPEASNSC